MSCNNLQIYISEAQRRQEVQFESAEHWCTHCWQQNFSGAVLIPYHILWSCLTTSPNFFYFVAVSSSSSLLYALNCWTIASIKSTFNNPAFIIMQTDFLSNLYLVNLSVWTYYKTYLKLVCNIGLDVVGNTYSRWCPDSWIFLFHWRLTAF